MIVLICIVCLMVLGGLGVWFMTGRSQNGAGFITPELRAKTNFPIYYPTKLPEGFSIDETSIALDEDVLFFTFTNKTQQVTVSQVAMPDFDPGLSWSGFEEMSLPVGKGYIGRNGGRSVALIATKKTLLNIVASPNVSDDVVSSLSFSLKALD